MVFVNIRDVFKMRYNWLAIRNPLNWFKYNVLGIKADEWFDRATLWINRLFDIENRFAKHLLLEVNKDSDEIDTLFNLLIGSILLLLTVVIVLYMIFIRDILYKLRGKEYSALFR